MTVSVQNVSVNLMVAHLLLCVRNINLADTVLALRAIDRERQILENQSLGRVDNCGLGGEGTSRENILLQVQRCCLHGELNHSPYPSTF